MTGHFKPNNFDLIRLLAASQVMILHTSKFFDIEIAGWIRYPLINFPGVPIFFFISGFLISLSWERSPSIADYCRNRLLRIYPALWVCLIISLGFVFSSYNPIQEVEAFDFIFWLVAQSTFLQFYNPEFMREFGTGVLNGSLWTIPLELQFYFLTPFVYLLIKNEKSFKIKYTVGLIIIFSIINLAFFSIPTDAVEKNFALKLVKVSFIPFFYMFLLGILAQKSWTVIKRLFEGKLLYWLLIFAFFLISKEFFNFRSGNETSIIGFLPLAGLVLSASYTFTTATDTLLKRNDISYGIYIYHMPILNFLISIGIVGLPGFILCLITTIVLAIMSWRLVERPILAFKKTSLRAINA